MIHSDGIDFHVLGPLWFAVLLFIALPLATGIALAAVADSVADPDWWTARGRWRWALPLVLLALVPLTLAVIAPLALVVATLLALRRVLLERLRSSRAASLGVRSAFFVVPPSRSSPSARTWPRCSEDPQRRAVT